eukprot:EG_transcript_43639
MRQAVVLAVVIGLTSLAGDVHALQNPPTTARTGGGPDGGQPGEHQNGGSGGDRPEPPKDGGHGGFPGLPKFSGPPHRGSDQPKPPRHHSGFPDFPGFPDVSKPHRDLSAEPHFPPHHSAHRHSGEPRRPRPAHSAGGRPHPQPR